MKQTIGKKIFIISGVVLALLTIWMAGSVLLRFTNMGIIAGAGTPTMIFLIRTHPAFIWSLLALAVFAGTGIVLLIRKHQNKA